ncbi:hypothetical protein [Nocardiopsis sp. LOL_012]
MKMAPLNQQATHDGTISGNHVCTRKRYRMSCENIRLWEKAADKAPN